jgi:ammonia channel protein AmtB
VTFVLLVVLDKVMGLRVPEDVEREGLDTNLHGEQGYIAGGTGGRYANGNGPEQ